MSRMIRGGFLSEEDRNKLTALARDGSVALRDATRKRLGAFGRRLELSGNRRCVVVERRHDPWLVQTVSTTWDRGLDQFRHGRERELFERRAGRRIESLCQRGASAFDSPDRSLDREGIRARL